MCNKLEIKQMENCCNDNVLFCWPTNNLPYVHLQNSRIIHFWLVHWKILLSVMNLSYMLLLRQIPLISIHRWLICCSATVLMFIDAWVNSFSIVSMFIAYFPGNNYLQLAWCNSINKHHLDLRFDVIVIYHENVYRATRATYTYSLTYLLTFLLMELDCNSKREIQES